MHCSTCHCKPEAFKHPPMRCPTCGSYNIGTSKEQAETGDLEMVQCRVCHYKTDAYEAMKQAEVVD